MNQDAIAQSLSTVLTELLKHDMSDPELNLMDCGLTSIHAIQVISRIRDMYEVELPIIALFQVDTGTVSGLSSYISALKQCQAAEHCAATDSKELVL